MIKFKDMIIMENKKLEKGLGSMGLNISSSKTILKIDGLYDGGIDDKEDAIENFNYEIGVEMKKANIKKYNVDIIRFSHSDGDDFNITVQLTY